MTQFFVLKWWMSWKIGNVWKISCFTEITVECCWNYIFFALNKSSVVTGEIDTFLTFQFLGILFTNNLNWFFAELLKNKKMDIFKDTVWESWIWIRAFVPFSGILLGWIEKTGAEPQTPANSSSVFPLANQFGLSDSSIYFFQVTVLDMTSLLWHCWLGGRKGIRPLKTECWYSGGGWLELYIY